MDHYKKMMEEMEEPGDIKACIKVKIKKKSIPLSDAIQSGKKKLKKLSTPL